MHRPECAVNSGSMATAITVASFQAALSACADAVLLGDFPTAQKQLAVAEIVNAGLEVEVASTGSGGASVKRRESLTKTAAMVEQLRQLQGQATGRRVVATNVGYGRRRGSGWGCR